MYLLSVDVLTVAAGNTTRCTCRQSSYGRHTARHVG